ncbi:hypothetical protein [Leifsonia soli]|uniref:Uncharacterized protein n=1 Tax=Leifsonia soli TaxID=582665 RepID=A0A852SY52_9MICO|nr:hypothetical protein [Leifsonia soli]NYD73645.1 hypothetical protein [Leifsonia soli]
MSHPRNRIAALAAVAIAVCLLATACTGTPAPGPTTARPTATGIAGLPTGVQQATDVPTDVPNTPELRKNVALASCEKADGGWRAGGTASNPTDTAVDYTITVFFTTDTGTVLGTADTTVSVGAKEKKDWTATAALTPAPKTVCVLRGVG